MKELFFLLSLLISNYVAHSNQLPSGGQQQRILISDNNTNETTTTQRNLGSCYYYETTETGSPNIDVTIGNPLKGICANPDKAQRKLWPEAIPASLHVHKRGLDEVLMNDPDVVGAEKAFNWTIVDEMLKEAEEYRSHAIIRFYIHWSGMPLSMPDYLLQPPYSVTLLQHQGEKVPWYGDENLRKAMKQFIYAFGEKYDGDRRIFAIQAGIMGVWGEWHTQGCEYKGEDCGPEHVHKELVQWYSDAFQKTHIQFRYPRRVEAFKAGFGFHDDAYTYTTVGGEPNGGFDKSAMFWTMANIFNTSDFWKQAPMGGEVHPNNVEVFHPNFKRGTEWRQDFNVATKTVHATYAACGRLFSKGGVGDGPEQDNAIYAHSRMGYNFQVNKLYVSTSLNTGKVDIDVIIQQTGVAPFYFPLSLDLSCVGIKQASTPVQGDLSETGSTVVVSLKNIPATVECLKSVELKLESPVLYADRPIKWAQGKDGKVILNIPLPPPVTESCAKPPLLENKPVNPPPPPLPPQFESKPTNPVTAPKPPVTVSPPTATPKPVTQSIWEALISRLQNSHLWQNKPETVPPSPASKPPDDEKDCKDCGQDSITMKKISSFTGSCQQRCIAKRFSRGYSIAGWQCGSC